ncbi:histidine kinase [Telluribacter sp.]|jgi:sensor histidine kinase YesM|uniref:sensor histidine kinase n=1 Tax=Telluribacter sp. TaxID=1978767 RepID=UPI002E0DD772|nr:histidine kinase [Telluribacter sp.]
MKKATVILLHLSYWLLYCFLVSFLFLLSQATEDSAVEDWEDWVAILLFALLTGIISFYAFYGWLVPRYLTTRRVRLFVGVGLVVSSGIGLFATFMVSMATTIIIYIALHQTQFIFFQPKDQLVLMTGFTLLAVVNGMMGTVIRGFITWYTDIHMKEMVAGKALRTEIELLKAQLNPHFLFNTLNNIDILIELDAPRASQYLNKLSDLLRFTLYETQADQIPLTHELAYIKKYIELQKVRTPNEQYVTLHIEGPAEGVLIAPMLFIPYIENAFKYATNKKVPEAIRIYFSVAENQIQFRCINVVDKSSTRPKQQGGLGQRLLRQRLTLLYQETYTLDIQATKDSYSVHLVLPVHAYEMSTH